MSQPATPLLSPNRRRTSISVRRVHWTAPVTILVSFALSIALSVSHHSFYRLLDGQAVDAAFFSQQENVAIGTALSFLVRVSLLTAITSVYWQIFWKTLQDKTLAVSTIDSLSGLLSALPEFFNNKAIVANPIITGLALLSWIVPVAIIFPPATLTVGLTHTTSPLQSFIKVPDYLNRDAFGIVNDRHSAPNVTFSIYSGPTHQIQRLGLGVAYQGEIPLLQAPAENASYTIHILAPTLQCRQISQDVLSDFADAMGGCDPSLAFGTCQWPKTSHVGYGYISWVPQVLNVPVENISIATDSPGKNAKLPFNYDSMSTFTPTLGRAHSNTAATIFVASRGNISTAAWDVLNCTLWNASYTVEFSFQGRGQRLSVSGIKVINPVVPEISPDATLVPADHNPATITYQAMMDVMGQILAGAAWYYDDSWRTGTEIERTLVMQTNLARSPELVPVYNQSSIQASPQSLAEGIEELFRNMTLAIFSDPSLLRDEDHQTTIDVQRFYNIYIYSYQRLAVAYGLAIALTFVAVVLGCHTLLKNGVSYSNKFSTILRTTRGQDLDVLVEHLERGGEDPLPQCIGEIELRIRRGYAALASRPIETSASHPKG